ncbi:MAG: sigma-70 family RNA polymerase sigma factor [Gemmataceae bacterium]
MTTPIEPQLRYLRRLTAPSDHNVSDADLLQRFVLQSDETAFTALLVRHGSMVHGVCRRILRDSHDAEDAFQATFLVLARKAGSIRRPQALSSWLYGIARHLASSVQRADSRRRQREIRCLQSISPPSQGDLLDDLSARELLLALDEEIQRLPDTYRLPLILCHLEGHPHEEAARLLGWTAGSVKGRLERGRKLLHARLSRRGLALSGALLALGVSQGKSASAATQLTTATLQAAVAFARGDNGGIAGTALALAESAFTRMTLTKGKVGLALLLAAGLTAGKSALVYPVRTENPAEAKQAEQSKSPKEETIERTRADLYGDPLPTGAIARLGTVRLRHGDSLDSLRFAPDGRTLISMGADGVRVWETATGKPVRHFGAGISPRFFALSSDGRRIALYRGHAGQGGPVEVWDVATGQLIHQMGCRHYSRICFSPDGKQLAAMSGDPLPVGACIPWNIDLWDAETGRDIRTLTGPKEKIWDMAYSADGKTLLLGGSGRAISLRSTADGTEVRRLGDLPAGAHSLVLSPRGDRVAIIEAWIKRWDSGQIAWSTGSCVIFVNMRTGAELRRWSVKPEFTSNGYLQNSWRHLAFSPDGRRLAASQNNGPVRVWDTDTGAEKRILTDGRTHYGGVVFAPDGKTLAVEEGDNLIRLIDAETGADRLPTPSPRCAVTTVALSRDGRTAFTADAKGAIQLWDALTGRERGRPLDLKANVVGLLVSPDGRTLFARTNDKSLRAWDVDASAPRWRRNDLVGIYRCRLALSPDGEMLAVIGGTAVLKLFKTSTGEPLRDIPTKTPIWDVAFAPDASAVYALTARWIVRRWETAGGRPLPDLKLPADPDEPFHDPNVWGNGEFAVLSPDGRLAAYALDDKLLRLLDVFKQREIHRFTHLPGTVATMSFAGDGRSFVWAERSGVIHVLELVGGGERRTLPGHTGEVSQLVFSRGGKHLISASHDTTALVWDLIGQGSTKLSAEQRDACWSALADKDAAKAYRAMCRLIAAPTDAVSLLHRRLRPVESVDEKHLQRQIADLDADAFAVRESATEDLRKAGELAESALRKALASRPTLEMSRRVQGLLDDIAQHHWRPSPKVLRQSRAVEVLERIGTSEARRMLETLGGGGADARLTQEAKASLARLSARSGVRP